MTNYTEETLEQRIARRVAEVEKQDRTNTRGIIILIMFVILVMGGAIMFAIDQRNKLQADPEIGFLYSDNLNRSVLIGCAQALDQSKTMPEVLGLAYAADDISDAMLDCLKATNFQFFMTENNRPAEDILVKTVFRQCIGGNVNYNWFSSDNSDVVSKLSCLIKSGLTLKLKQ